MSLHFAAARSAERSPIARALSRKANGSATNDNGDARAARFDEEAVLVAALRHFAEHGLAAAEAASAKAQQALDADDTADYEWWLEICRSFDRGEARRLQRLAG